MHFLTYSGLISVLFGISVLCLVLGERRLRGMRDLKNDGSLQKKLEQLKQNKIGLSQYILLDEAQEAVRDIDFLIQNRIETIERLLNGFPHKGKVMKMRFTDEERKVMEKQVEELKWAKKLLVGSSPTEVKE